MNLTRKPLPVLLLIAILTGCGSQPAVLKNPTSSPVPTAAVQQTRPPAAGTPAGEGGATMTPENVESAQSFAISSHAFQAWQIIPSKYTCDGVNISPPLEWKNVPAGTKSFALIMDDPDAPSGTFTHWVLFNLPASQLSLAEGASTAPDLKSNHGTTSWRKAAYGGPCPPSGTHHYIFTLYAVDTLLKLPAGSSRQDLVNALQGHILAQAQLVGLYSRS